MLKMKITSFLTLMLELHIFPILRRSSTHMHKLFQSSKTWWLQANFATKLFDASTLNNHCSRVAIAHHIRIQKYINHLTANVPDDEKTSHTASYIKRNTASYWSFGGLENM